MNKDNKKAKTQLPLLRRQEQNQGTTHDTGTTKGVERSPKPPLQPTPPIHSHPHPV